MIETEGSEMSHPKKLHGLDKHGPEEHRDSSWVRRDLEAELRAKRDAGRKLLLPYVTAGIVPDWLDLVDALADAGADAIEIGIPFSDPAMDGPTIEQAGVLSLERGTTPQGILSDLRGRTFGVPLIAMTYYNLVFRYGHQRFAADLAEAGGSGTILPDLPPEMASDWTQAASDHGLANILLAAPVTTDERLSMLAQQTRGFLYTVSTMGTTGERSKVDRAAQVLSQRIKAVSDMPAIIGFGISTPEHAVRATETADGVIIASALMRKLIDGEPIEAVARLVSEIRQALDESMQ